MTKAPRSIALASLLAACGSAPSTPDAAAPDAKTPAPDAAAPPFDASTPDLDAGFLPDAEPADALPAPDAACIPGGDGTYLTDPYDRLSRYCLVSIENGRVKPLAGTPYDLNTPLFSDDAVKLRTVWLPPGTHATYSATAAFSFPTGTIITKSFGFRDDLRKPDPAIQWIETRLLIKTATVWKGVAYKWHADMSEADVSYAGGVKLISFIEKSGTTTTAHYLVPNANQCRECHAHGVVMDAIGPKARNLNRSYAYPQGAENQLAHWSRIGILQGAPANPSDAPVLPVWNDPTTGSTTARARAYLEVNCAHCHNGRGAARTTGLVLWASNTDPTSYGVCKFPVAAGMGSGGFTYDVDPGHPDQSVLAYRIAISQIGILMPPLSRSIVDHDGVRLVKAWIRDLPGTCQ